MASAGTVAVEGHYNALEEKGLEARKESRIYYMRNFNNWVKSQLIQIHLDKLQQQRGDRREELVVLDLCCGKGGDLLKWKIGRINHLICADIAGVSLEQCENRFKDMKERASQERRPQSLFTAQFIHADCSKVRLREKYKDPNIRLDMCSCQFSLHYSFESCKQAHYMLRNACENLKPGGYFVGTIPNSDQIVNLVNANDGLSFKNEVMSIKFEKPATSDALFGATYDFNLHEVVNCPEYLVHFPLLEKLLKKYDMELVYKKTFSEVVDAYANGEGKGLLARMQGLEPYPPDEDVTLMGVDKEKEYESSKRQYEEIVENEKKEEIERNNKRKHDDRDRHYDRGDGRNRNGLIKTGTLSKSEWEAAAIYLTFAFRKTTPADPGASVEKGDSFEMSTKEIVGK